MKSALLVWVSLSFTVTERVPLETSCFSLPSDTVMVWSFVTVSLRSCLTVTVLSLSIVSTSSCFTRRVTSFSTSIFMSFWAWT